MIYNPFGILIWQDREVKDQQLLSEKQLEVVHLHVRLVKPN